MNYEQARQYRAAAEAADALTKRIGFFAELVGLGMLAAALIAIRVGL
jgi:hypothetical protein